jgi:restriction endonuclease S subunit
MSKVEIFIEEIEAGVFNHTDYRFDLKFYSPKLKKSYERLLQSPYSRKLVKDKVDPIREGLDIVDGMEYEYLQIGDIDGDVGEVISTSRITSTELPSRAQRKLTKGDIAISSVRPLLKEIVIVPDRLNNQIGTTGLIILRCKEDIIPEYLFHILRSDPITDELDRRSSALNYPAIHEYDVQYLYIPIPPLEIQNKLVEEFHEGTSQIREIKRQMTIISKERNQILGSFLRKHTSVFVEPAVTYSIDEVEKSNNQYRIDVKYYRYSKKHPYEYIKLDKIVELGRFKEDPIDLRQYLEEEFLQVTVSRKKGIVERDRKFGKDIKTNDQIRIRSGDIVASRIDLYNKCVGIVPEHLNNAIVTTDFIVFSPFLHKVHPIYLIEVLKDDYMSDYFYAFCTGSTGRKRITRDMFKQLKVPLLQSKIQETIVHSILIKEDEINKLRIKKAEIYKKAEEQFLESLYKQS